jgi:AcrR family transcriptional regulator
MSESRDPIREQLIEARRNQILDAAAEVFSQKGFHRATTKEIARTAGVSEGTIYNYFDSKGDLLIGMMSRIAQAMDLDWMIEGAFPDDPRAFLVALLRYRQSFVKQYAPVMRTIMSEILIDAELGGRYYRELVLPVMDMAERQVEARIEAGQLRPLNAPLFARMLVVINIGLFLGFFLGDPVVESEWEKLVEVVVDLLFDGIGPAKEREQEA